MLCAGVIRRRSDGVERSYRDGRAVGRRRVESLVRVNKRFLKKVPARRHPSPKFFDAINIHPLNANVTAAAGHPREATSREGRGRKSGGRAVARGLEGRCGGRGARTPRHSGNDGGHKPIGECAQHHAHSFLFYLRSPLTTPCARLAGHGADAINNGGGGRPRGDCKMFDRGWCVRGGESQHAPYPIGFGWRCNRHGWHYNRHASAKRSAPGSAICCRWGMQTTA